MICKSIYFMIIFIFISVCTAYDRKKAREYAKNYCKNPNKEKYPIFDADCTNFASQVLKNGGILQNDDWYCIKGSCSWWETCKEYNGFRFKKSWTVVDDLYNYLIKSKIARECSPKDLKPGDLIQYKKSGWFFDDWYHTTIVVEQNPTNPKLVYHSSNKCDSNHSFVKDKSDGFRAICIIK
ncbi:putative amidase domain-containing protein [Gigaspora rosea]|uniref:Putative amidase domain-containing protein n=1 Tax=Gigaspora rosea TaxID=44941 RepID=A0A397VIQ0_9GLOM|nr:putative amidase domain-containing protein [Gigaspora rosea]